MFTDRRPDTLRLATYQVGVHTYRAYGDRSLDDVIFEGLGAVIAEAGHRWIGGDSGQVRIDLQLFALNGAMQTGAVDVGAWGAVQMRLDFVEVAANRVIYSQGYSGQRQLSRAIVARTSLLGAAIDGAVVDCVAKVARDPGLATALRAWRGGER
jgi:hypothetical protein